MLLYLQKVPKWVWWLSAPAWTATIFILSVMPSPQLPESPFLSTDKLAHAVCYGLLWVLWWHTTDNRRTPHLVGWAVAVIAYGVAMEYVQYYFFPYRFFEVGDMIANTVGVILAAGTVYALTTITRR